MSTPEQERERIAGVYSGMSNDELQLVASTGYQLSEVARERDGPVMAAAMSGKTASLTQSISIYNQ